MNGTRKYSNGTLVESKIVGIIMQGKGWAGGYIT